jgi:hypothetical protein
MNRPIAILLALSLLVGCEEKSPPGSTGQPGPFPDQILSDFEVEMTRGELKSAVIDADKGVIYRKRDSMILQGLTARLYDSDGLYSSTLWSDSGLLRERQKRMLAYGHVRMISEDSTHLVSDSLYWYGELVTGSVQEEGDSTEERYMVAKGNVHLVTPDSVHLWTDTLLWHDIERRVATDAYVTIVRRNADTLRGIGLRSDDQLQTIKILKEVRGHVTETSR